MAAKSFGIIFLWSLVALASCDLSSYRGGYIKYRGDIRLTLGAYVASKSVGPKEVFEAHHEGKDVLVTIKKIDGNNDDILKKEKKPDNTYWEQQFLSENISSKTPIFVNLLIQEESPNRQSPRKDANEIKNNNNFVSRNKCNYVKGQIKFLGSSKLTISAYLPAESTDKIEVFEATYNGKPVWVKVKEINQKDDDCLEKIKGREDIYWPQYSLFPEKVSAQANVLCNVLITKDTRLDDK